MTTQSPLPVVSVIGRPNVGKSTLFNRILGRREAIVEERPGVTRDRKALEAEWLGHSFLLVDTGGWMPTGSDLDGKVSAQSERAIDTSDLIVMVVDGATGITEEDTRVAWILRRSGVRVILAVNKIDSPLRDQDIWEFMSLGLGDPLGVSALHSRNTGDLLIGSFRCCRPRRLRLVKNFCPRVKQQLTKKSSGSPLWEGPMLGNQRYSTD